MIIYFVLFFSFFFHLFLGFYPLVHTTNFITFAHWLHFTSSHFVVFIFVEFDQMPCVMCSLQENHKKDKKKKQKSATTTIIGEEVIIRQQFCSNRNLFHSLAFLEDCNSRCSANVMPIIDIINCIAIVWHLSLYLFCSYGHSVHHDPFDVCVEKEEKGTLDYRVLTSSSRSVYILCEFKQHCRAELKTEFENWSGSPA